MNYALLLTFLIGLFFILGIYLYKISNNKKSLAIFSSSCAFVIILGLIIFDLLPEVIEYHDWLSIIFVLLGLFILKIIDLFIPHHEHHHKEKNDNLKEHKEHLEHIGIITIIALTFHNFIEGIGLYSVALTNLKSGIMMMLAISFHNLPLGIEIGNIMENKKNYWLLFFLVISSLVGGVVALLFGDIPTLLVSIILSLTLGMILHILIFELLGEVINNREKKETYYGIIVGIVVLIVINLL